jgi:hypothetical protein
MKKPKTAANARRKKALTTATKDEPKAPKPKGDLTVHLKPGENQAAVIAAIHLRPTLNAALIVRDYCAGTPELSALMAGLTMQADAVSGGDLTRAEATLIAQAHSLDAIFVNLARRAALNAGQYMGACETYLRLALKAQSQCRATLETLAAIKNPPVIYARQANVTTGPQQVNNGMVAPSRGREIESQQSKLSGGSNELLPDARASTLAGQIDPHLATVGEINRAKDGNG